jgi:hypothetical protein
MPVIIIFFGILIGMASMNGKIGDLGDIIKTTVYPEQGRGFFIWVAAIIVLASLMRILNLPEAGKALIVLVVLAYFLSHADIPQKMLDELNKVKPDATPGKS